MPNSILKQRPIKLNFEDIRSGRQANNNKMVYNSLKCESLSVNTKKYNKTQKEKNKKIFLENINYKEFERTLEDLCISEEELFEKCRNDDIFCRLISRHISKKASRQGSRDETEQLRTCNIITEQYGITIENLSINDSIPTKEGEIISKKTMNEKCIYRDCCLKSFDGKLMGKMNGFISAKVAYGYGGHQDNVFEEMDTLGEWWKKFKSATGEILILLIDTNLTQKLTRLKEKYHNKNNIMVFNHVDFQEYIINNYSILS